MFARTARPRRARNRQSGPRWRARDLRRFWRGEGPEQLPAQLHRRRVYILPTRAGLGFALVLMIMLIGAINYNNSLGYLLTFLLGSVGLVAVLHTYRNLLNLEVSLGLIEPVFAGETARVPVLLDNFGLRARLAVRLNFVDAKTAAALSVVDIAPDGWQEAALSRLAKNRGRHPVGRFTISTTYPLGLFRAWAYVEPDRTYLTYPRPYPRRGLPGGLNYQPSMTGDQGHGSDDFAGFRNYHPGDSLRHINWKAMAREQGLLTKRFGGDRIEELWLDWRTLDGLDREARLSRLTRWVLEAAGAGLSFGLWLPGLRIEPDHGPGHRRRCLEALALFEAPGA